LIIDVNEEKITGVLQGGGLIEIQPDFNIDDDQFEEVEKKQYELNPYNIARVEEGVEGDELTIGIKLSVTPNKQQKILSEKMEYIAKLIYKLRGVQEQLPETPPMMQVIFFFFFNLCFLNKFFNDFF